MRNPHVWNVLGLHVPNLLPGHVPWFQFNWHHGFTYEEVSHFPRRAGRLIWATVIFLIGCGLVNAWIKRPKRAEPATWAQTILGALGVWFLMTLGYGVIPSEWIIFGNSYLNFDSSTFLLHRGQWAQHLPPFDITRDKFIDAIAGLIYVIVLVINVRFFVAWQKRKAAEAATEGEGEVAAPQTGGGPLARLRARRAERVSAYGRPVTTSE